MAFQITPLSIEEMVREARATETLYVANNSGVRFDTHERKMIKQTLAIVHVSYRNNANELTSVAVPPTWVPINLAEYCSLEALLASENFRNLIRINVLVPVRKSDAETIRASSEARDELAQHAGRAGTVGANGRVQEAMATFQIGPSGAVDASTAAVADSPVNSEALSKLLDDFNNSRISDAMAAERFRAMPVSLDDITTNMIDMSATDSLLFAAMSDRIETLEVRTPPPSFQ